MTAPASTELHAPRETTALLTRVRRCMSVSVVSTIVSVTTLIVATAGLGIAAVTANVMATTIATFPSYHLNRRWVWGRRDRSDVWRELLPFWTLAFAGLALSSVTVGIADSWAGAMRLAPVLRTAAILVGHLGGFGLLWVFQFLLLEHVLFRRTQPPL